MIYCHLHFTGVEREANKLIDTIYLVQQPLRNLSRLVFATTCEVGDYNTTPTLTRREMLHITRSFGPDSILLPTTTLFSAPCRTVSRASAKTRPLAPCESVVGGRWRSGLKPGFADFQFTSLFTAKRPFSGANFERLASPRHCSKRWVTKTNQRRVLTLKRLNSRAVKL